jgi:hypothetical protein
LGLAFDRANIWVANNLDNAVTKLRASDGLALGTFRRLDGQFRKRHGFDDWALNGPQ